MTKKQLLATLVVSTLALAQAGFVSADELAPIDSSAPTTEVVTPGTSSASTEAKAPAVQPTEPSITPVDPTAPSDKDNVGSLDGVPADKPAPSDKAQDKDNAGSLDGVPDEQPKTTDQANQQGKSQIGTTSTSTGQAVHDITKAPVQTNTGVKIVSTENGLVKLSDGSLVTPEAVGAVTNADKTISVTKADGKKATLPHTGEAQSLLSFLGAALLTVAGYVFRKKQA
ncbi:LPXTG cell wall anchor domain-containing protein [Streptococcus sp. ACC21]|uniref:LPXTG cell wall anchor domain-containing protein n=1 Tax=Streptococcus sp. ACC21 TaxID=1161413 RepID=UPI00044B5430|nr:LPXTG cell wall anchor domain-containing protein [Streptococcus sp. ACC21]EUB12454.1 LPXTG cell wall anchor domain protein [Streptococcus sp. ACC21]